MCVTRFSPTASKDLAENINNHIKIALLTVIYNFNRRQVERIKSNGPGVGSNIDCHQAMAHYFELSSILFIMLFLIDLNNFA